MENPTQVALNSKRDLLTGIDEHPRGRSGFKQAFFDASYTGIFHLFSPNCPFLLHRKNDSPYDAKWLPGACKNPILPHHLATGTK